MNILKNIQTSKILLFEKIKIQINTYFDGMSKDNSNKITSCNIYNTCGVLGITNFDGIPHLK
jgi:hypothetical protein